MTLCPALNSRTCSSSHIGSTKWAYDSVHQVSVYYCHHPIFITIIISHQMESNSNQYCITIQLHVIPHMICLFCISWWDCVGWMFKETYLDFTALIIIVHPLHLTAQTLHTPLASSCCPTDTPASSILSSSWCWASSSDHVGLSFEPVQTAGGHQSLCYHNHWVQSSIAMWVELWFAPVGQPMQMPGAADAIPRTS
jgi:hypothetical protein